MELIDSLADSHFSGVVGRENGNEEIRTTITLEDSKNITEKGRREVVKWLEEDPREDDTRICLYANWNDLKGREDLIMQIKQIIAGAMA